MDLDLEQKLRAQLGAGERLIWSGRPAVGLRLRANDAFLIPFSLMWAGFSFFWEYSVLQIPKTNPAAYIMPLWGIPFVCVGIYLVVGRFFWDAFVRGRTYYGLSNQRAIIVADLWINQVKSLPLTTLAGSTLSTRADGTGTVMLGAPMGSSGLIFGGRGSSRRYAPPAFEMIPDANRVYSMLRDAQQKAV